MTPENPLPDPAAAALARAKRRELVGLLLLICGLAAVTAAAFATDWRLGATLVGVIEAAIGFNLTTTKE